MKTLILLSSAFFIMSSNAYAFKAAKLTCILESSYAVLPGLNSTRAFQLDLNVGDADYGDRPTYFKIGQSTIVASTTGFGPYSLTFSSNVSNSLPKSANLAFISGQQYVSLYPGANVDVRMYAKARVADFRCSVDAVEASDGAPRITVNTQSSL